MLLRRDAFRSTVRARVRGVRPLRLLGAIAVALTAASTHGQLPREQLERLAAEAVRENATFRAPGDDALATAASGLRSALPALDGLLARSRSGPGWREYLDWPALQQQAASGTAADPAALRRLEKLLGATETGLDMPEFVRVRKAVTRYAEAADAARGSGATRFGQRLDALAAALSSAASDGRAESLAPVPLILERLAESGQSGRIVPAVRGLMGRPNILLAVHEDLLAGAVNRPVHMTSPIDEVVLGTRVRGDGVTSGSVRLDFVPCRDRAAFDLVLAARNVSSTRGSQGPVTVHTRGVTDVGARRRIFVDEAGVTAAAVEASASTDTDITGIGVSARCGKRLIRRIAERKIAQTKPRAEAVAERRARDKTRESFTEQTQPALAQFQEQFESRVRRPLRARGLYPEMLHINTSDSELAITARKAIATQLAAGSHPPAADAGNLVTARIHESAVNNVLEDQFGGRRFTHLDVERLAREMKAAPPESLAQEDQKEWAVTFSKHRPITLSADDGRVKLMIRGDKFVSGEREFPGMDIWVTYALGSAPFGKVLVREGDVQIYPPGFKPGGGEKLTMAETSLRRILQKRFDKVFKSVIEIPDIPLQGEMASAGPLTLTQLESRRDGWVAAGWRKATSRAAPPLVAAVPDDRVKGEAADMGRVSMLVR